jgi:hypothetical protein
VIFLITVEGARFVYIYGHFISGYIDNHGNLQEVRGSTHPEPYLRSAKQIEQVFPEELQCACIDYEIN